MQTRVGVRQTRQKNKRFFFFFCYEPGNLFKLFLPNQHIAHVYFMELAQIYQHDWQGTRYSFTQQQDTRVCGLKSINKELGLDFGKAPELLIQIESVKGVINLNDT